MSAELYVAIAVAIPVVIWLLILCAERRRRRQVDRWAGLMGIRRMPDETTPELAARVREKMRIR